MVGSERCFWFFPSGYFCGSSNLFLGNSRKRQRAEDHMAAMDHGRLFFYRPFLRCFSPDSDLSRTRSPGLIEDEENGDGFTYLLLSGGQKVSWEETSLGTWASYELFYLWGFFIQKTSRLENA